MRIIWAIAAMAMRNAVRSRVVLVLLALLLLVTIGLPLTIKSDGTLTGQVQILLNYTLNAISVILAIATVWAGCAAVSQEVQERQIHLLVTKPVRRAHIWAGKWLGLLVMNAALLALSGGLIYGALRWTTRPAVLTPAQQQTLREEILVARRLVLPVPVDVAAAARQELARRQARGDWPRDAVADQVYQAIKQTLLMQAHTVPAGFQRQWTFRLPARRTADEPLLFRYRFATSQPGDVSVRGIWLVGPADRPERYEVRQTNVAGGLHTFSAPATAAGEGPTLTVEYANVNPEPIAVLFSPEDGLQLLVHEGGFAANFVRGLLVVFGQLALLGAVAVTAGALMSLPVAALLTGYLVLLMELGSYLESSAAEAGPFFTDAGRPTAMSVVVEAVLQGTWRLENAIVRPLQGPNPLEWLAAGRLVDWWWVGSVLVTKVMIYSGCLALVGIWLFNRREIALPS